MIDALLSIAGGLILLSLVVVSYRLVVGPTTADRAVALDGMTIISISLIGLIAHLFGRTIYLDVAMIYALVSFLGIVALARYLERGLA